MNPLVLLGLGLAVAMAAGKKRGGNGNGNGAPDGNGNGDQTTADGDDDDEAAIALPLSEPGKPRPGTFYPITAVDLEANRDPVEALASLTLFGVPTMVSALVRDYAECQNRSDWNRYYFGRPSDAPVAVDGMSTDLAFQTSHVDMQVFLENGRWPYRAQGQGPIIPPTQRRHYGLYWLPALQGAGRFAGVEAGPTQIICPEVGLNPPQSVLDQLAGVAPPWAAEPEPPGGVTL